MSDGDKVPENRDGNKAETPAGTSQADESHKPRRAIPPMPPKPNAPPLPPAASPNAAAGDAGTDSDSEEKSKPEPTRYGDWEKNGRCIDF